MGLSDFSDGMSGFVKDRKAVELRCFGMGWFGVFWEQQDIGCFFVLGWSWIFLFSFEAFCFVQVQFIGFVYLKFVYDFSIVLNVLTVVRYRLDYWMVKGFIGLSSSQSGNPQYKAQLGVTKDILQPVFHVSHNKVECGRCYPNQGST